MNLNRYLGLVDQAINKANGATLSELFRLDVQSPGMEVAMQVARKGGSIPVGEVHRALGQPWGGIVAGCLQAYVHHCNGERLQACQEFREKHIKVLQGLVSDQIWVLPAIVGSATTLRMLSSLADDEAAKRGGNTTHSQLQQCAMLLQGLFGKTAAAKGADAELKRAGAVAIGCVMLKVYFRLNTLNNCKNIIKTIDGPLNMFAAAQKAHQVTYRYYTGRLSAYDEDFLTAEQHLSFALHNCHPDATANKRRILRYLIPVKMLLGTLPNETLLQQYKLTEYADIADSVRTGNIAKLLAALEKYQVALVQAGTYLLLEKLQLATYRRLFKKCALVHAEANPAKAAQLPLALFSEALRKQGVEKDDAELQCLVANLIYRKYIKGYIAFKSRVIVLAKTDAFPPLATVQLADPFGS